jgi:extradiol dioxygenase family protein
LHLRPDEVLPSVLRGVRHFGVSLPPRQWSRIITRCRENEVRFLDGPRSDDGGAYKAKFEDPSGNVIEVKSYSDVRSALGVPSE